MDHREVTAREVTAFRLECYACHGMAVVRVMLTGVGTTDLTLEEVSITGNVVHPCPAAVQETHP